MITTFHELKSMIVKVCRGNSDAKDYEGKHAFVIDMRTLDNMFSQKGLDYHVMAGTYNLESYVPYVSDIHTLADYVENSEMLIKLLDGYTQIAIFSIFSTHNKDGEIIIGDEENPFTTKQIFTACNHKKKLDIELMSTITKQVPNYKVLVARKFNTGTDSFVYEIFFRSNKQMAAYYRSLSDKKKNQEGKSSKVENQNGTEDEATDNE